MDYLGGTWAKQKREGSRANWEAARNSKWNQHLACWSASHGMNYAQAMSDPQSRADYYSAQGRPVPERKRKERHPPPCVLHREPIPLLLPPVEVVVPRGIKKRSRVVGEVARRVSARSSPLTRAQKQLRKLAREANPGILVVR